MGLTGTLRQTVRRDISPEQMQMTEPADDPSWKARKLLTHWHEHWSSCGRLSDVPLDRGLLLPWVDDLALFELVEHDADFRLCDIGENLAALLGCGRNEMSLSEIQLPFRHKLRQVLLRATMTMAPALEHYEWLIDGSVCSSVVCAVPIARGFHQPSRLILGVFRQILGGLQNLSPAINGQRQNDVISHSPFPIELKSYDPSDDEGGKSGALFGFHNDDPKRHQQRNGEAPGVCHGKEQRGGTAV